MTTGVRAALLTVSVLLGSAVVWGQANYDDDIRRVRDVVVGIVVADNARDLSRVLALYAHDAVLLPPNETPVRGIAAIEPRYTSLFTTFTPDIQTEIEELQVTGDWAFVRGNNHGRLKARTTDGERLLSDVYVMILRRSPQNSWQITTLMWHASPKQ